MANKWRTESWVCIVHCSWVARQVVPRLSWRLFKKTYSFSSCWRRLKVEMKSHTAPLDVQLASALQICQGTAATLQPRMIHPHHRSALWMFSAGPHLHELISHHNVARSESSFTLLPPPSAAFYTGFKSKCGYECDHFRVIKMWEWTAENILYVVSCGFCYFWSCFILRRSVVSNF